MQLAEDRSANLTDYRTWTRVMETKGAIYDPNDLCVQSLKGCFGVNVQVL